MMPIAQQMDEVLDSHCLCILCIPENVLNTVPLKSKLTVPRILILASRNSKFSRIESRVEFRDFRVEKTNELIA